MRFGIMYEQGMIVVVPFPFTDLSSFKQRPVLVISKNEYNRKKMDIITCGITSNLKNEENSFTIDNSSLSEGTIPTRSRVKVDKIFTLEQTLVKKSLAKLKPEEFSKVRAELEKLI